MNKEVFPMTDADAACAKEFDPSLGKPSESEASPKLSAAGVRARPARCPQCKREGFLHATWCPVGMNGVDLPAVPQPVALRVREVFKEGPGPWRYFSWTPGEDFLVRPTEEMQALYAVGVVVSKEGQQ